MGIYYTLYNLTKSERVEGYWKSDPFCDVDKIADQRNWTKDDIIVTTPDTPGDIFRIVFINDEWDIITLNGIEFNYEIRTEENAQVLDAWPANFTSFEYLDGKVVLKETQQINNNASDLELDK